LTFLGGRRRSDTTDPELARRAAKSDLAKNFWDLGNAFAGFSILQFLGFLAVTYSVDEKIRLRMFEHPWTIIFWIAASTFLLFIPSICFCYRKEVALRVDADPPALVLAASRSAVRGRII
jgi:hypothetical protein